MFNIIEVWKQNYLMPKSTFRNISDEFIYPMYEREKNKVIKVNKRKRKPDTYYFPI